MRGVATRESDVLRELLALQKESSERDTRIETRLENISDRLNGQDRRLDKQDETLEKLSSILADQKHLSHTVDSLSAQLVDTQKRVTVLENSKGKFALSVWNKVATIVITVIVTAVATGFVALITNLIKSNIGGN